MSLITVELAAMILNITVDSAISPYVKQRMEDETVTGDYVGLVETIKQTRNVIDAEYVQGNFEMGVELATFRVIVEYSGDIGLLADRLIKTRNSIEETIIQFAHYGSRKTKE